MASNSITASGAATTKPVEGVPKKQSAPSPPGKMATSAAGTPSSALDQVLEVAESHRRTAAEGSSDKTSNKNKNDTSASSPSALAASAQAALPPVLGSRRTPGSLLLSPHERMMAAMPPSLSRTQSLDAPMLGRTSSLQMDPPFLGRSSSMMASIQPPGLRPAQSLDLGAPSLGRSSSLELAAAAAAARRRAAALSGTGAGAYPGAMFDPRRLFLAQQAAASAGFMPCAAMMMNAGAGFGGAMGMGMGGMGMPPAAAFRNMPNEGVSGQGLELLRAASMSLPNRGAAAGGGSFPATTATSGVEVGTGTASAGVAPENSRKRKAGDGDSSDEEDEGGAKVFIPEVRDFDILCGRGGKSNHHFGNKRYRQVVSEMKAMYRGTEAKTVKTDLSRAIVDHVCGYGARFVRKDSATGQYYLLTKSEARKKTSQALRETKALKWTM